MEFIGCQAVSLKGYMFPDFNKNTVKILGERAAYLCSNPDCRISTIGPNSNPKKSTILGEGAHIYGAREKSKRFVKEMTDQSRAEVTNGIWLCKNCHKKIDTDDELYTSEVIFKWREMHEKYVQAELGNSTDRILYDEQCANLSMFIEYPPLIRRILIDKPDGWEWRLAAELMRHLNAPLFRKIDDLRNGLYVGEQNHISDNDFPDWIDEKLAENVQLMTPISKLLQQLTNSFGKPGESGDRKEILHICLLLKKYIEQSIVYEEKLYFVHVSQRYERLVELLRNVLISQIEKLQEIPISLDEVVSIINSEHGGTKESPLIINKTIEFDVPDNWCEDFELEIKKANNNYTGDNQDSESSLVGFAVIIFIIFILLSVF
jgi:hypothetical protein